MISICDRTRALQDENHVWKSQRVSTYSLALDHFGLRCIDRWQPLYSVCFEYRKTVLYCPNSFWTVSKISLSLVNFVTGDVSWQFEECWSRLNYFEWNKFWWGNKLEFDEEMGTSTWALRLLWRSSKGSLVKNSLAENFQNVGLFWSGQGKIRWN